jgi:hypothetical protein
MREFATALKRSNEEETYVEFKIAGFSYEEDGETVVLADDATVRAYAPTDGQLVMVASNFTDTADNMQKVAAAINFFTGTLDEDSLVYVKRRLLDRHDPFGVEEVTEILEWLLEEWSARPTKSSSGSSASPVATGRRSTGSARRPALTR